uniref:Uncharacterized protein n=1 Tax=Arundo donax TaxID=35708 RepID=A0A0A9DCT2_ARUDO
MPQTGIGRQKEHEAPAGAGSPEMRPEWPPSSAPGVPGLGYGVSHYGGGRERRDAVGLNGLHSSLSKPRRGQGSPEPRLERPPSLAPNVPGLRSDGRHHGGRIRRRRRARR